MVVEEYKFFNKKFFAKTVTWKAIDGIVTFTLCYILTGELFISVNLAILEVIVESVFYYFHEHIWAKTNWGEYKMDKNIEVEEPKTVQIHWKDSEKPELVSAIHQTPVDKDTKLKEWLVNYVGKKYSPDDEKVTVNMIVETIAQEFPEFLLSVAEENWVRGYQQALDDSEIGRNMTEEENEE
jgi:Predicted membrane protein